MVALYGSESDDSYSESELAAFRWVGYIEIILFSFLLLFAVYNTVFFLCRQKRYKIYFITIFYVLAYIVVTIRFILALMIVIIASNIDRY